MGKLIYTFAVSLFTLYLFIKPLQAQETNKHRVVVLTDIEADPDDTQTLIRLLLYSNSIDIRGLIATTSVHQKSKVAPESIKKVIEAYRKVQPNLKIHDAGFPEAGYLLSLVKASSAIYGMQGVGEGKDSEGSDWIIKELEKDDDRPLWISVWGGANTLAQALYKINNTKSKKETEKLISKLRVYTISDQDDSGIWMRKNFPELFYVVSPGGYGNATWLGVNMVVDGIDNHNISNEWIAENIQQGHGPLGTLYPDVAYGMEGDTPAWLSLIDNGLNEANHPDWGGWGGRYEYYLPEYSTLDTGGFTGGVPIEPEPHALWTNSEDTYRPYVYNAFGRAVKLHDKSFTGNKVTLWRWRDDFQNDFAARMDWCTMSYKEANHPPIPALGHSETITVKSGNGFVLDASGSTDPDGDNVSYLWFHYPEAGTYNELIKISSAENLYRVWVIAPEVEKRETAHFILKVSDKGTPRLSRYKRVIVEIIP